MDDINTSNIVWWTRAGGGRYLAEAVKTSATTVHLYVWDEASDGGTYVSGNRGVVNGSPVTLVSAVYPLSSDDATTLNTAVATAISGLPTGDV